MAAAFQQVERGRIRYRFQLWPRPVFLRAEAAGAFEPAEPEPDLDLWFGTHSPHPKLEAAVWKTVKGFETPEGRGFLELTR